MKQADIAAAIERDLLRVDDGRPSTEVVECFMCGYGMTYKRSRFCLDRCCDYFDAGNPGYRQDWLKPNINDVPFSNLRVIAGRPGALARSRGSQSLTE